jgi:hypothetical protein
MHGSEGARQAGVALHEHAEQEEPAHAEPARKKKYNPFLKRHTLHRETR